MILSNAIYCKSQFGVRFKFHRNSFLGVYLTITQQDSGNGLAINWRQGIKWTDNDSFSWCIYAPPDRYMPYLGNMAAISLMRYTKCNFNSNSWITVIELWGSWGIYVKNNHWSYDIVSTKCWRISTNKARPWTLLRIIFEWQVLIKCHWSWFLRVQLTMTQHWLR